MNSVVASLVIDGIKLRSFSVNSQNVFLSEVAGLLVQCHRMYISNITQQLSRIHRHVKFEGRPGGAKLSEMQVAFATKNTVIYDNTYHSETPYGEDGNNVIHAAHDFAHVYHNCDFSLPGESRVVDFMEHISSYAPANMRPYVRALFYADTLGMQMYYAVHGKFPENQTDFLREALLALDV